MSRYRQRQRKKLMRRLAGGGILVILMSTLLVVTIRSVTGFKPLEYGYQVIKNIVFVLEKDFCVPKSKVVLKVFNTTTKYPDAYVACGSLGLLRKGNTYHAIVFPEFVYRAGLEFEDFGLTQPAFNKTVLHAWRTHLEGLLNELKTPPCGSKNLKAFTDIAKRMNRFPQARTDEYPVTMANAMEVLLQEHLRCTMILSPSTDV